MIGFAPQRRSLCQYQYLNFQNLSEHLMILPCSHRNVLRATQFPKVPERVVL